MIIVYLCLTCLRVSAEEGDCHDHPMVRCGADEPTGDRLSPRLGLHPLTHHWLVDTLRELQSDSNTNVNPN